MCWDKPILPCQQSCMYFLVRRSSEMAKANWAVKHIRVRDLTVPAEADLVMFTLKSHITVIPHITDSKNSVCLQLIRIITTFLLSENEYLWKPQGDFTMRILMKANSMSATIEPLGCPHMNIALRRFLHNYANIATEGRLKTGLCPTIILKYFKGSL